MPLGHCSRVTATATDISLNFFFSSGSGVGVTTGPLSRPLKTRFRTQVFHIFWSRHTRAVYLPQRVATILAGQSEKEWEKVEGK